MDNLEPFLIDGDALELLLINCPLSVLVFSGLALIRHRRQGKRFLCFVLADWTFRFYSWKNSKHNDVNYFNVMRLTEEVLHNIIILFNF